MTAREHPALANERPLRVGDVVEVRPPDEILATLDQSGALDGVPFMPEMLQYIGKRFRVTRRVEKICDTIAATGSRRMPETVYLDDLRCDGSGHGGCQAGCRLYWKEAWLRRCDDGVEVSAGVEATESSGDLAARARSTVMRKRVFEDTEEDVWRCQATDALGASTQLKTSDLRQYWRELSVGNVGRWHFLRVVVPGFFLELSDRVGLLKPLPLAGTGTKLDREPLGLQPGDFVEVRSKEEIAETLDAEGFNRGLSFDREMLPYCGRIFRVRARVRKLVDDRTGRMLEISRDCIILEGVVCSGERSAGRWFCPREIYPYWREAWLKKVDPPVGRAS